MSGPGVPVPNVVRVLILPRLANKYALSPQRYSEPDERSAAVFAYVAIEPEIPLRAEVEEVRTFLWNVKDIHDNIKAMAFNILRDYSAARHQHSDLEPKPAILTVATSLALAMTHHHQSGDFASLPPRSHVWAKDICYDAFTTEQMRDCKREILEVIDQRLLGHRSPYSIARALNCLNLTGGEDDNPAPPPWTMDSQDVAYARALWSNRALAPEQVPVRADTPRLTCTLGTAGGQHGQLSPVGEPAMNGMLNWAERVRHRTASNYWHWGNEVTRMCQPAQQTRESARFAGYHATKARYVEAEAQMEERAARLEAARLAHCDAIEQILQKRAEERAAREEAARLAHRETMAQSEREEIAETTEVLATHGTPDADAKADPDVEKEGCESLKKPPTADEVCVPSDRQKRSQQGIRKDNGNESPGKSPSADEAGVPSN